MKPPTFETRAGRAAGLPACAVEGARSPSYIPRAVSSAAAFSQALPSREETYTLAPLVTKPSEIIRPMPFAPPVTRTTFPCRFHAMALGQPCLGVCGWEELESQASD